MVMARWTHNALRAQNVKGMCLGDRSICHGDRSAGLKKAGCLPKACFHTNFDERKQQTADPFQCQLFIASYSLVIMNYAIIRYKLHSPDR